MVAFSDRVVVPSHVRVSELAGESALLNLQTERYFGLDAIATRMWHLATTEPNIQAAYSKLSEEFDVEPELLRCNLTKLLNQLIEYGLLRVAPTDVASLPEI